MNKAEIAKGFKNRSERPQRRLYPGWQWLETLYASKEKQWTQNKNQSSNHEAKTSGLISYTIQDFSQQSNGIIFL